MKENKIQKESKYEALKLENQICFPLYAATNKVIRKYKPLLDDLNLTYTQYITMMVLWEKKQVNEKQLGKCLFLKSNTLAPLLKKLENKGYITRNKDKKDERNLIISITKLGEYLKKKAVNVPKELAKEIDLSQKEAENLYKILYKILEEK